MKRFAVIAAGAAIMSLSAIGTANAFVVGGENGWQFSTDGFVNVFAIYQTTEKTPAGVNAGEGFLTGTSNDTASGANQKFSVRSGLLPEGVGFNIKAPTTNGVDMGVRIGIYPQIQNSVNSNININPNIDFREIYFTAEGKYGQLLAGRALNLYQGKNILTDMTLFTVGVVGPVNAGPTMGHIGYGYLYPNFGAQIRYTTPSMSGVKVALSVNDAYAIDGATTTNVPKFETEISYANGRTQAWVSALVQSASFPDAQYSGKSVTSLGGAGGVSYGTGPVDLLLSAWGGQALGMAGVQWGAFGSNLDNSGKERTTYGFLAQAVYKLDDSWKFGLNYGQNRADETNQDKIDRINGVPTLGPAGTAVVGGVTVVTPGVITNVPSAHIKSHQAIAAMATYNLNKSLQFVGEYTWAQDQWFNGGSQASNVFSVGTFFYW